MSTSSMAHQAHHHCSDSTDVLGFWLYIMTDCVLFGSIFAAFLVLHQPGSFGPLLKPFVDLYYVLGETAFLLLSNLVFGIAIIASYKKRPQLTASLLILTFLLGLGFVGMELNEFIHLVHEGYSWTSSASASAFFTLVGTHGLHVSFGLLWIAVMIIQILRMGLNGAVNRRLVYLGLFWNFLDIVWIFVFTVVYLVGAL
jgi:cytochrome o ubiquinol oxidase subunit 3